MSGLDYLACTTETKSTEWPLIWVGKPTCWDRSKEHRNIVLCSFLVYVCEGASIWISKSPVIKSESPPSAVSSRKEMNSSMNVEHKVPRRRYITAILKKLGVEEIDTTMLSNDSYLRDDKCFGLYSAQHSTATPPPRWPTQSSLKRSYHSGQNSNAT